MAGRENAVPGIRAAEREQPRGAQRCRGGRAGAGWSRSDAVASLTSLTPFRASNVFFSRSALYRCTEQNAAAAIGAGTLHAELAGPCQNLPRG
jgi:hypothetical protein